MKTILLLLGASSLANAAIPVVDGPRHLQAEIHHQENKLQLQAMHATQKEELLEVQKAVSQLELQSQYMGDPSVVAGLPGVSVLQGGTDTGAIAKGRSQILELAQTFGKAYNIYSALSDSFSDADGKTRQRVAEVYRPFAAVMAASQDFDATYEVNAPRRQALRQAAAELAVRADAATTDAEVQKIQTVLQALKLELDAGDNEVQFSANKALIQEMETRNEQARHLASTAEEHAVDVESAFKKLGKFLKPATTK